MQERIQRAGLMVDAEFAAFIETEALSASGVSSADFWNGLAGMLTDLTPRNRELLAQRESLQQQIDAWHLDRKGQVHDAVAYRAFLEQNSYLLPEGPDFTIETSNIDPEISTIAGPQLVVPVTNARYALNAANARWGNLYDALYGTDALGDLPKGKGFDPERGRRVVVWARDFLDMSAPLAQGSWSDISGWSVIGGHLNIQLDGKSTALKHPNQFVAYDKNDTEVFEIILQTNNLRVGLIIDRDSVIGKTDKAGIAEIWLEAAISVIMDCEDSVATVDGADKTQAYRNWLGLMKGDLTETVSKAGETFTRELAPDYLKLTPDGAQYHVKGRALMLIRNVGHLMTTPTILDATGQEIPEGLLDALVTVLCAKHDLNKTTGPRNSETGSIYIVKPKMHGPDEVAFTDAIFSRVEHILNLPQYTVKLGIMDEERRTTLNLKECIRAAKHRVAFINTGFLDRTGDEIHTSMQAGAMRRKGDMKAAKWIAAYEENNVDVGLACGLKGKAQIGKGMWAMPDLMQAMLDAKIAHPMAGANCAWVPSPTAATLHATHYHKINVAARQTEIAKGGRRANHDDILTIPLAQGHNWSETEITAELENNAQGILGYVVRWVDQGVGCSKVPDINNIGLMEDRATCRISSQHMANWLLHGVVSREQVMSVMRRMATVVDGQNQADPDYRPMAPTYTGIAFQAACGLVFGGVTQPSGYTEPILHAARRRVK